MLDLQDLLPYLFSVSLLLVLRYFYLVFLYGGLRMAWIEDGNYDCRNHFNPIPAPDGCDFRSRLSRMMRRREAPDEDDSDCFSSFDDVHSNERGGAVWNKQKDSFSVLKKAGFSV